MVGAVHLTVVGIYCADQRREDDRPYCVVHVDVEEPDLETENELDQENRAKCHSSGTGMTGERCRVDEKGAGAGVERKVDQADKRDAGDDRIEVAAADPVTAHIHRQEHDDTSSGGDPLRGGCTRFHRRVDDEER